MAEGQGLTLLPFMRLSSTGVPQRPALEFCRRYDVADVELAVAVA